MSCSLSNYEKDKNFICNLIKDSEKFLNIEIEMCIKLNKIKFTSPIEYVYNPLEYAKNLHEAFVKKYFDDSSKKIMFLGMNPGPWGMCQTGIPFGEKCFVQNWMQLSGHVYKPETEHPKKKISGLDCNRNEVSGKKFWGLFKRLCGTPEIFFKHCFIHNYCCLAFLNSSGKNITPPEIKDIIIRRQLYNICDDILVKIIKEFNFEVVVALGKFSEKCAKNSLKKNGLSNVKVCFIPHPSPRNAKNFAIWDHIALKKLQDYKLLKFFKEAT